jgi:hypothetical protein
MGSSTYTVTRERHIAAPTSAVVDRIVDFRRWEAWSPWEDLDPEMSRSYTGSHSGVGAVYEWDGNRKAGSGRMEITEVTPPGTVVIGLQFLRPFKSESVTTFVVIPDGDGSRVAWSMTGPHSFMTKVMGVVRSMDKMIGPDFEKGLAQLAADAES